MLGRNIKNLLKIAEIKSEIDRKRKIMRERGNDLNVGPILKSLAINIVSFGGATQIIYNPSF